MSIPKRLIQTGKTSTLSIKEQALTNNLKLLHPGWEYLYFDDVAVNDFVVAHFPEHFELFNTFPFNIQRYDFFRYLAIWKLGGFYFDLDVLLARPIDDLAKAHCVFPFEELTVNGYLRNQFQMDWEAGNYAFGAVPQHPFIGALIESCARAQKEPAWLKPMMRGVPPFLRRGVYVLNSTGPGMVSRCLAENAALRDDVTILFPTDVREETAWHHFGDYGVHLMNASWRSKTHPLMNRLVCRLEGLARARLRPESERRGSERSLAELSVRTA